jgi:hypothetical protein
MSKLKDTSPASSKMLRVKWNFTYLYDDIYQTPCQIFSLIGADLGVAWKTKNLRVLLLAGSVIAIKIVKICFNSFETLERFLKNKYSYDLEKKTGQKFQNWKMQCQINKYRGFWLRHYLLYINSYIFKKIYSWKCLFLTLQSLSTGCHLDVCTFARLHLPHH